MDHQGIECLLDELRRLVGWGATAQKLPSLPALRASLGVDPDLPYLPAGRLMRRRLLDAVRAVEPLETRLALQVLLRYDKAALDAPTRRIIAMRHLGVSYSVETWRRQDGPEREVLAVLAEHLGGEAVAA